MVNSCCKELEMLPRLSKLIFTVTALAIFASAQTTTHPALSYSTFLSASSRVDINASAIDANGYQYVTGFTDAPDFPTTPGAYNRTPAKNAFSDTGYHTMFVAKFNRTGTALIYSTFIAGASGTGIAVDSAGNAYVVGLPTTPQSPIPTTSGAWRPTCVSSSSQCSFLLKLNASGSAL